MLIACAYINLKHLIRITIYKEYSWYSGRLSVMACNRIIIIMTLLNSAVLQ